MLENTGTLSPTIALLIAPVAVASWFGVSILLARLSGWTALAGRYPGGRPPAGPGLYGEVIRIGTVREKGITVLTPTPAGLYLSSVLPFRFRRPPVLLPWADVRHQRDDQRFGRRWHTLDLAGMTTMQVSERGWQAIAATQAGRG